MAITIKSKDGERKRIETKTAIEAFLEELCALPRKFAWSLKYDRWIGYYLGLGDPGTRERMADGLVCLVPWYDVHFTRWPQVESLLPPGVTCVVNRLADGSGCATITVPYKGGERAFEGQATTMGNALNAAVLRAVDAGLLVHDKGKLTCL